MGSGPNGLAAAVTLASAGLSVTVVEGADTAGGGCRTAELTLPGYLHDVCSTAHPMVATSPFFRQPLFDPLRDRLRQPEVPFAHPLDGGEAAAALPSVDETAAMLDVDGPTYRRLMAPLVDSARGINDVALAPLRSLPAHPLAMGRFGLTGLLPADRLVKRFESERAKALLAGVSAHSMARLTDPLTSAFGLLLTLTAHAVGWPVIGGGSSAITEVMIAELERLGGSVITGQWVNSLTELPSSTVVVLDTAPTGLVALGGPELPDGYRRALKRFRYGPGVCKVDWALSGPVPWTAGVCRCAGTVHLGGTFAEVAASEAAVNAGRHPDRPFCIVVQPGVADPTRAPVGSETLWAYCHVPSGSTVDMTAAIEAQIERFAPGFSDLVVARVTTTAADEERHNPNYVGGDIAGGASSLFQTIFRPTVRWNPYRTPLQGVYLCSSSTPRAAESTGCAASTRRAPRSTTTSAGRHRSACGPAVTLRSESTGSDRYGGNLRSGAPPGSAMMSSRAGPGGRGRERADERTEDGVGDHRGDRMVMLRAAVERVGRDELKAALGLATDPSFRAPKAVLNALNALRKHRDPSSVVTSRRTGRRCLTSPRWSLTACLARRSKCSGRIRMIPARSSCWWRWTRCERRNPMRPLR